MMKLYHYLMYRRFLFSGLYMLNEKTATIFIALHSCHVASFLNSCVKSDKQDIDQSISDFIIAINFRKSFRSGENRGPSHLPYNDVPK